RRHDLRCRPGARAQGGVGAAVAARRTPGLHPPGLRRLRDLRIPLSRRPAARARCDPRGPLSAEFALRAGKRADLPQVAAVFVASRRAAFPAMPPFTRSEAEVRRWVAGWELDDADLWVAEHDGVLGFALATSTWL